MGFGDGFDGRKSDTKASGLGISGRIRTIEPLKEFVVFARRDLLDRIFKYKNGGVSFLTTGHMDGTVYIGVFDRIVDQQGKCLS